MSWQEIVRQIHALRKTLTIAAWYHPSYDDEAARLDVRLRKIIGKNYAELSAATIAGCIQ
jgi:hypothetical protein